MRIAFIGQKGFPATWGGIEVHVDEIARRLARRGHDVIVFNRRWYANETSREDDGVKVVNVPTVRSRSLDAITHSTLSTLAALKLDVDVFHFHGMGPSIVTPLPRLAGKAVVSTIHGFDYRAAKWGRIARMALRTGELAALRISHRTTVVAQHMHAHYAQAGYDPVVVRNGVTPIPAIELGEIRLRWQLERDGYIAFVARLEPDKRAHTLLRAFRTWRDAHPKSEIRLVIAGPLVAGDRYVSSLRALAGDGVVFAGEVAGRLKAELLSNALAVVSPSRFEGLPISLLEAMSAARPVLVSDIPAHREVVPDGAGIFCNADNDRGLAVGLERLLALSPSECAALGAAARCAAKAYRWDDAVMALELVYGEALGQVASRTTAVARSGKARS
jgi:glycosyltransferase involved in cell wall biosynthesis